ncbi:hypothetical protein BDF21DRAFT_433429 [Thamnidium elegans]|nr:hypothetical protein BDF21DRAFT_433429 [Thamnidium elegans]
MEAGRWRPVLLQLLFTPVSESEEPELEVSALFSSLNVRLTFLMVEIFILLLDIFVIKKKTSNVVSVKSGI